MSFWASGVWADGFWANGFWGDVVASTWSSPRRLRATSPPPWLRLQPASVLAQQQLAAELDLAPHEMDVVSPPDQVPLAAELESPPSDLAAAVPARPQRIHPAAPPRGVTIQ